MLKNPENKKISFDIRNIQKRAVEAISRPIRTLSDLEMFLVGWWCRRYNRPYKCPDVKEYTIEELLYEYFDITFRENPEALAKFKDQLQEVQKSEDEDEEWLKQAMGGGYITKDEQEKKIAPIRDHIDLPSKDEEDPDISYNFKDFV